MQGPTLPRVCTAQGDWFDTVKVACCPAGLDDPKKQINDNFKPNEFSIEQNYPNPFNPVTLIKFFVPVESAVELKIYDAPGKEVTTLVNGTQKAGNHEVSWDASGLSSGIYFYKLEAGSYSVEKKMILLK
ncbi:MAG: T9SS type A sorting domain-containing protein [Ignavibacteria bacterium]